MADSTITGLTENTTPLGTDLVPMVDDPSGSPITQKITLSNLGVVDGWVNHTAYTWTYASASTFTISGVDLTTTFTKGTRLRFKQGGGYKYATVAVSAFSTNTTVTIIPNISYSVADAAITDNYYSYAANPLGYPGFFSYTPTLTSGNADLSGYDLGQFYVSGNMITVRFAALNRNLSGSAGAIQVSVPVDGADGSFYYAILVYNGTAYDHGLLDYGGGTTVDIYKTITASNWAASETGVKIAFDITYRF